MARSTSWPLLPACRKWTSYPPWLFSCRRKPASSITPRSDRTYKPLRQKSTGGHGLRSRPQLYGPTSGKGLGDSLTWSSPAEALGQGGSGPAVRVRCRSSAKAFRRRRHRHLHRVPFSSVMTIVTCSPPPFRISGALGPRSPHRLHRSRQ